MRKFCKSSICVIALTLFTMVMSFNNVSLFAQEDTTVSEEAKMLYEDALDLQKKGNMPEAISSYIKALRKDRTVLAFDDNGLIEAAYEDSLKKLKESPDDVKLLEVCGFLSSVGYSDNETAIEYYKKIIDLVQDEKVKEKTQNLIDRLVATTNAQQEYDKATAASMRDERVRSWAEMEKMDQFAAERSKAADVSSRLNDAYSSVESLQNKIPQMEDELKELQESYNKANRLWYTLKDELYERRRRRLKNDIAAKQSELEKAKKDLRKAERDVSSLEKEDEKIKKQQEESTFNQNEQNSEEEDEDSPFNEEKPTSEYSDEPSDGYEEDNSEDNTEVDDDINRSKQIDELIDEL